jgi:hypothetical protein
MKHQLLLKILELEARDLAASAARVVANARDNPRIDTGLVVG